MLIVYLLKYMTVYWLSGTR